MVDKCVFPYKAGKKVMAAGKREGGRKQTATVPDRSCLEIAASKQHDGNDVKEDDRYVTNS